MKVVMKTMVYSGKEMVLWVLILALVIFLFSSVIFFFEGSTTKSFVSISTGLWFCFSTLTTIGYGDVFPVTPGKINLLRLVKIVR